MKTFVNYGNMVQMILKDTEKRDGLVGLVGSGRSACSS